MNHRPRQYVRFTRVIVLLGVALLGVDVAVGYMLRRTGEQSDVSRIVDEQQRTDAMYLSLLNDNEYQYKVELVRDRGTGYRRVGLVADLAVARGILRYELCQCGTSGDTDQSGTRLSARDRIRRASGGYPLWIGFLVVS